jgi:hypothetical protein
MVQGASRWVGWTGWALIVLATAATVVPRVSGEGTGGSARGTVVLICLLGICALGLLATVRWSPMTATTLALSSAGGLVTGLCLFALMPFERAGAPLAGRVPWGVGWLVVGVLVLAVPCVALVRAEDREPGQASYAVWHLCAVAALTIFAAAVVAIRLFPGSIPDIVPVSIVWQGDGPAKALQYARDQSAIEAVDPYVLPLLVATLLLAVQGAATAVNGRRRSQVRV